MTMKACMLMYTPALLFGRCKMCRVGRKTLLNLNRYGWGATSEYRLKIGVFAPTG